MGTKEIVNPIIEKTSKRGGPCTLIPNDKNWKLCPAAENKLKHAVEDGALLIVNDKFLVKLHGRLAGLALEDDGEFKKGVWYEPSDSQVRESLKRALGKRKITFLEKTEWVEIREVTLSPEKLEKQIETGVNKLNDGSSRFLKLIIPQEYLERYEEIRPELEPDSTIYD